MKSEAQKAYGHLKNVDLTFLLVSLGGIHKRRTHARGEGGLPKVYEKCTRGEGFFFKLCTYTFLKMRAHQIFFVCKKSVQKKSRSRVQTRKNRIFDFLNSGGRSVESVRLFRGVSSKVYFVDRGEGAQKLPKMCVRLLWTPPNWT